MQLASQGQGIIGMPLSVPGTGPIKESSHCIDSDSRLVVVAAAAVAEGQGH